MAMADYEQFIATKSAALAQAGIAKPAEMPAWMFPHQAALTRWALRKGRAAVFADTGLGKTFIELVWAQHVAKHTGGRVLILAPLAVAQQIVREGATRGLACKYLRKDDGRTEITVSNYEMLHAFDPRVFQGIVCDESSILKAMDGRTRAALTDAFKDTAFKLCGTATPAPNDFTELGNHSEFLNVKTRSEMLSEYFVHDGGSTTDWRIKGHAIAPFWRWVAGWGAVVKSPADLGFDASAYELPPLRMHEHAVEEDHAHARESGLLFPADARTLSDQRRVRRSTMGARVKLAAELAKGDTPCLVWCELNAEADACEGAIPDALQVRGANSMDEKTTKLLAFSEGRSRVLISKASLTGHGLNWQHCSRMIFLGASHSYEQTYQAIRRCWRFGQKSPVDVHVIRADTERFVIENYRRKEADAARLAAELQVSVAEHVMAEIIGKSAKQWNPYKPGTRMQLPEWLGEDSQ